MSCWIDPAPNAGAIVSHSILPCFTLATIVKYGTYRQVEQHIAHSQDWAELHRPHCQYAARPKA